MVLKVGWFVALASILFAGVCVAFSTNQQVKKNDQMATKVTGHLAFADEDWASCEKSNREILAKNPDDGEAWFYLGLAQHYQGEYVYGRDSFYRAISLGYRIPISYYNIACTFARQGEFEQAMKALENADLKGFPVRDFAMDDPDMEKLRKLQVFQDRFAIRPEKN
ncbi:MAG: hypothetical protein JNM28_07005 [Armatimonadetes bacterium]|nr:hypothetical protein [Armatimonadota bacterium]MBS1711756.1 hypothetical protein [Armatimonadota bacterium]MBX3109690.1 hypothetical protein [Fimbriimonadaceae bacterium]